MSLLERHLEQIALSSESISTLPFPPPKIFTNALLHTQDITSLIRDTEPHERALFSVPPPPAQLTSSNPNPSTSSRRQTVFNVAGGEVTAAHPGSRAPRRNTAVAAVLGAELHSEVRKNEGKGDINIEVLLRGAEKLNAVYSVPGVPEKINNLRERYAQILSGVKHYENKVDRQTKELERINRADGNLVVDDDHDEGAEASFEAATESEEVIITDEDLRKEEEEIRLLERRKKELEERVSGMERDLGGLSR